MSNVHVRVNRIIIETQNVGAEEASDLINDLRGAIKKIRESRNKVALVRGNLSGTIYGLTNYGRVASNGNETHGTFVVVKQSAANPIGHTETGYKDVSLIHEVQV